MNLYLLIKKHLHNVLCNVFFIRSKEIDWQPYFTTRIVDDFGTHLRVFRKAQQKITEKDDQVTGNISFHLKIRILKSVFFIIHCILYFSFLGPGTAEDLIDTFFEVEVEMEKDVCRDLVCTSPKDEEGFIFNLTLLRIVTVHIG